jgi:putative NADH-flavin reductase
MSTSTSTGNLQPANLLEKGTGMNVTVFGAIGQIGQLGVSNLLVISHDVTAYVRNPGRLGHSDPRLVTTAGELSDERIQQAVRGADAVISALGPLLRRGSTGSPGTEMLTAQLGFAHLAQ